MMKKLNIISVKEPMSTLRPRVDFEIPAGDTVTDALLFQHDDPTAAIAVRVTITEAELGSTILFKRLRPDGEIWTDPVTIKYLPYVIDTDYCRTQKLFVSASGPLKGSYYVGRGWCPE
ncbi:hypothetical protein [Bacillus toyonensis]|uniref:hypothetical protein n=1 Tax=Bacillus toyonensis TaxID=155322 RepID=UPI001145501D|nr:hypothetical protein [Bacillus toyonensis]